QRRVEARHASGAYPADLEADLATHFDRIVAFRLRAEHDVSALVDAVRDVTAFDAQAIASGSRKPGGDLFHRFVGRAVVRQTEGILDQVRLHAIAVLGALDGLATAFDDLAEHVDSTYVRQLDMLHARLDEQTRRLNRLEHELETRVAEAGSGTDPGVVKLDPWYTNEAFEAAFRGSREQLVESYTPLAHQLAGCAPTLDIGFGRGELLEVLGSIGVDAYGIETDAELVKAAADRGLAVDQGDGLAHLRGLPDAALGGLALIQVVEHLSPQGLVDLVALAARKVRRGGRVVIETVNPQSLYVYARAFYLDPTHVRPVHPSYLTWLFREAGFDVLQILWRNPPSEAETLGRVPGDGPLVQRLNTNIDNLNALVFAAQDYALVAER
ncbi:MAG: methyltransferase domain-containing protein, partial [Acidimicrobiia bacterium]